MSSKHLTPEQVAAATLEAHAIKPEWRRTGEQVAALIAEAVKLDREAFGVGVAPSQAEEYAERVASGLWAANASRSWFGFVSEDGETADSLDEIPGYDAEEHDADNLPEQWERASAGDWLADVLDIQYVVDRERRYRSAHVFVTVGGPTAYVDTETRDLVVSWGSGPVRRGIPFGMCEAIDEYLGEYFAE